jgi:cytochrome c oxidase subunit III
MMFIGLTSAYVVSQGLNPVWKQLHLRPLIWIDTGILLFSSYTMEQARSRKAVNWLLATFLLGLAFLAGQIGVFQQLANEGFYLNTGRQASFYYVLTGLHGLHVLGGIFALGWTAFRMKKTALEVTSTLEVTSIYWHFMGALWIFLLVVIFI